MRPGLGLGRILIRPYCLTAMLLQQRRYRNNTSLSDCDAPSASNLAM